MNEQQPKHRFKFSYLFLVAVLVLIAVLIFTNRGYKGEYLQGGDAAIEQLISGDYVNEKSEEKEQIVAYYTKGNTIYFLVSGSKYEKAFPDYADYYYICRTSTVLDGIIDEIAKNNVEALKGTEGYTYIEDKGVGKTRVNFWDVIYPVLYLGFGIFMVWMIFRLIGSSNKGAMTFGKSKARAYTTSKVRFSDIAGTEEEKEELKEIVEFLKAPQKFTNLGARIPKGVLLVGPPGTGKTLLARAVAGEANVPFISISGSDFVEMFVGVGASRVRDLFEQAKKNKPCIVFIDEIDAVGRQRGAGLGGGNDEREQTLNQLLVEMDGFEPNEGIIVLAATNRSDVLDPALMRPGRFDRQIYVHVPDVRGREGILKIHAKGKPIDPNVDFATLAKITVGFTGADIENMLNEAAILAARENRPMITMTDIQEGINKVTMGPQKKSRVVTEKDRKLTAYHESGHAILAEKLEATDSVQEVSIIPRGMAGGYTMQRPESDNSYRSYSYLMDEIAVFMGGRIAEEIIFKDITTGASSDISQATKIARNMIYHYGMSKNLGFLSLDSDGQVFIGRDYQTKNDFSEKLAAEADDEVREILDYNYKRAKKVLMDNIDLLEEMAKLLLDQETINKEEIDMLISGKNAEEVSAYMNERAKKRKEEEAKVRKEQEQNRKKKMLEDKMREGEKLVQAGIISQSELDSIKEKYNQELNEDSKQEETKEDLQVKTGLSVEEESDDLAEEVKTEEDNKKTDANEEEGK